MPVYGTEQDGRYPDRPTGLGACWSRASNIDLRTIEPDTPVALEEGVRVTAFTVPHRDEFTDTVGYLIEGPHKSALFIPDIDQWQKWSRNIREVVGIGRPGVPRRHVRVGDEVPGRSIADIPHPLIPATRELLKGVRAQIWFIHLNHTNKEIDAPDVVRDGRRS